MDWLLSLAYMLQKDYYPILVVLSFVALAFSKHRKTFMVALVVVLLLTPTLKTFYQEERPDSTVVAGGCADSRFPSDEFGFPSGHAVTSILLAAATLGSFAFFFFLPVSVFIGFSRVYLGCHSINQVIAGISLGFLIYFILQRFNIEGRRKVINLKDKLKSTESTEIGRQLIHIIAGFGFIWLLYWLSSSPGIDAFGVSQVEMILLAVLMWGLIIINMKMLGMNIGPLESVLKKYDRKNELFPGRGPLLYLVGVLLIISFSKDYAFIPGALAIFAAGDGFSTLIGRKYGRNTLPWNKYKTWEGMVAFFVTASIASYFFIGTIGLVYSAFLAVVETLDFHVDDNLLIPMFAMAIHIFLG
ncbi:MAG: phosphatase PAP2 family protein [Candidatus Micrarchaeota archaeon]